jgi:hypothetical protein
LVASLYCINKQVIASTRFVDEARALAGLAGVLCSSVTAASGGAPAAAALLDEAMRPLAIGMKVTYLAVPGGRS